MTLKIATWNLQRPSKGGPRNAARLRLLKEWMKGEQRPDIWVLTETREVIDLGEGWHSLASFPLPDYHAEGETLVTIWSRWPIAPVSVTRFTACAEILIPELRPLLIYGTVLPWDKDKGPTERIETARWEEHHRQVRSQTAEWITLAQSYPEHFLCIAGDFNQHRGALGAYRERRSVDRVTEALATSSLHCVTVDPPGHEALSKPLVDHVCLPQWAAAAASVTVLPFDAAPVAGLSDHPVVVVTVPRAPGKPAAHS